MEANVRHSVERLHDIVEREVDEAPAALRVVGAVYELETGRVRLLE